MGGWGRTQTSNDQSNDQGAAGAGSSEEELLPGRPVQPRHASPATEEGQAPESAVPGVALSGGSRAAGGTFPGAAVPPSSPTRQEPSAPPVASTQSPQGQVPSQHGPYPRSTAQGVQTPHGPTPPVDGGRGRKGPSWLGLIAAMLVTAMATILAVFVISPNGVDGWGGGERPTDASKPGSEDQAGALQIGRAHV